MNEWYRGDDAGIWYRAAVLSALFGLIAGLMALFLHVMRLGSVGDWMAAQSFGVMLLLVFAAVGCAARYRGTR